MDMRSAAGFFSSSAWNSRIRVWVHWAASEFESEDVIEDVVSGMMIRTKEFP